MRAEMLRPFMYGGIGAAGMAGAGIAESYGIDGGALKFFWSGLTTASPMMATGSIIALIIVWITWQNDRKSHARRDDLYAVGMNKAAQLRESDKREKAKLREKIRDLENEMARSRRRRRA